MAKKHKTKVDLVDEREQREAGRSDTGAGNDGPGAVDGLGGVGGSSGAGSVRATPRAVGDLSGLDQRHGVETPPMPGADGTGSGRANVQSDGGLPGMTRGPDSESMPNQDARDQGEDT
jgi:hypothetical protein